MSTLFVRNTRLTALTIGLILVAGASSWYVMPRMEDPLLTERFAIVATVWPGADAERVESLVTEKIEQELREIREIDVYRSISTAGSSVVNIELRDDIYGDEANEIWSRVRDRVDDASLEFPPGVPDPPPGGARGSPGCYEGCH